MEFKSLRKRYKFVFSASIRENAMRYLRNILVACRRALAHVQTHK